jgi:hypothetical protein
MLNKEAEIKVQQHYERAGHEMEQAVKAAVKSIQNEVKEVLQSNLVQAFVARLALPQKVSAQNVRSGVDVEQLKSQVERLLEIGKTVGLNRIGDESWLDKNSRRWIFTLYGCGREQSS